MASIILDVTGKPIQGEIASIATDITYPAFLGVLRNRDDTLLTRGGGGGSTMALKIYDDIERDCHAYAVLQKRKMAVVARVWEVREASTSRIDKKAADMVRERLAAINFDLLTYNALDAVLKGFSVGEIMWDVQGAEIGIQQVIPRDQRRFTFGVERELRMLTLQNMPHGEVMPDKKFIVHSFGGKDGIPFGLGLGSRLFWPVLFKRQDIKFWLTFADKFGSPTLKGTYQQGSNSQKQELLDAMAAISQDAGIAVPEGVMIELLDASRSGSTDNYEKLAKYMDDQISEAVLGETLSTNARGGGLGGTGAANVHNEVRMELVKADADLLAGTLNRTLMQWLTDYNMPGATPPTLNYIVEEQTDLLARAQRDRVLFAMGRDLDDETFNEVYGDGYVRVPVPKIPPSPPFAKGGAQGAGDLSGTSAFAEATPTAATDLADHLATEAADPWDAVIRHIKGLAATATSMQDLQNKLLHAYDGLPLDDLRKVMAHGYQTATLAGMADAGGQR
jgi:phage gp29-like protein